MPGSLVPLKGFRDELPVHAPHLQGLVHQPAGLLAVGGQVLVKGDEPAPICLGDRGAAGEADMTPATYAFLALVLALPAVIGLILLCRRSAQRLRARELTARARK